MGVPGGAGSRRPSIPIPAGPAGRPALSVRPRSFEFDALDGEVPPCRAIEFERDEPAESVRLMVREVRQRLEPLAASRGEGDPGRLGPGPPGAPASAPETSTRRTPATSSCPRCRARPRSRRHRAEPPRSRGRSAVPGGRREAPAIAPEVSLFQESGLESLVLAGREAGGPPGHGGRGVRRPQVPGAGGNADPDRVRRRQPERQVDVHRRGPRRR